MLKMLPSAVTFLAGSVLGCFVMHFLDAPFLDEPTVNYQTINFPDVDSKIFASARIWGLTNDHEEVRFCSNPIEFQKSEGVECMKFFAAEVFYRRELPNVLHVYALPSSVPNGQSVQLGQVKVKLHERRDYTDLEKNYDAQGLAIIAAP